MKFFIRKEELEKSLKIIMNSKSLSKIGDDINTSSIMIESDSDNQKVTMTAMNYNSWCVVTLDRGMYSDVEENDISSFFNVKKSGKVFVDGFDFIKVMSGYPKMSVINFSSKQESEKELDTFYLESISETVRGRKIRNLFSIRTPEFFQNFLNDDSEKLNVINVPAKSIYEAVNTVEFASGTEEGSKIFWGVLVEIYGEDDIVAMATDRKRMCYYDKKISVREKGTENISFVPIKIPFLAALKNLNMKKSVEISIYQKRIILRQERTIHVVPNVVFAGEKLPDWRDLVKTLDEDKTRVDIVLPKKCIEGCVKRGTLSGGGYSGIKISINTEKKQIEFSMQKIIESGSVKSMYAETVPLEESQFSNDFSGVMILTIDNLKDIVLKSKSESMIFRVKDMDYAIQIVNKDDHFGYIASTVKYM